MNYENFKDKDKQFLSLTSLELSEFETLHSVFSPLCTRYFRYHTLEGKKRKTPTSQEHGNSKLQGSEQKLFFLFVYLKSNALQEHQAASFDVSQTKVSRISRVLLSLLDQTLLKMGLMPYRDGELLKEQLKNHRNKVFIYDGMERSILRNSDEAAQEEEFSGKKKGIK